MLSRDACFEVEHESFTNDNASVEQTPSGRYDPRTFWKFPEFNLDALMSHGRGFTGTIAPHAMHRTSGGMLCAEIKFELEFAEASRACFRGELSLLGGARLARRSPLRVRLPGPLQLPLGGCWCTSKLFGANALEKEEE